jgi:hypothetical protein
MIRSYEGRMLRVGMKLSIGVKGRTYGRRDKVMDSATHKEGGNRRSELATD